MDGVHEVAKRKDGTETLKALIADVGAQLKDGDAYFVVSFGGHPRRFGWCTGGVPDGCKLIEQYVVGQEIIV